MIGFVTPFRVDFQLFLPDFNHQRDLSIFVIKKIKIKSILGKSLLIFHKVSFGVKLLTFSVYCWKSNPNSYIVINHYVVKKFSKKNENFAFIKIVFFEFFIDLNYKTNILFSKKLIFLSLIEVIFLFDRNTCLFNKYHDFLNKKLA